MNYLQRLFLRLATALFIIIFGLKIIYFIFSPLTFYSSYLTLLPYSPSLISQTSFLIQEYKLNFIPACTAGSAYLLLILLTIFTDIKPKKTLKVIALGSLIIFIANIIRIDILIYTLITYGSELFNTLHLIIWDFVSTIFVVGLWIFLTYYFKIEEIPVYSDFKKILAIYKKSKK